MADRQISELVKASIESKIIEAFRDTPQMIDELVKACLKQEVNEYGQKPNYHTREKMPYLTWLARQAVQDVAADAVRKHVATMQPQIKEQVEAALSSGDVVDAFTKNIVAAASQDWKIEVIFRADSA
jgi:hypothetical protein